MKFRIVIDGKVTRVQSFRRGRWRTAIEYTGSKVDVQALAAELRAKGGEVVEQ